MARCADEILVTLPRVRHGMLSVRVTLPGLRAHAGRTGNATQKRCTITVALRCETLPERVDTPSPCTIPRPSLEQQVEVQRTSALDWSACRDTGPSAHAGCRRRGGRRDRSWTPGVQTARPGARLVARSRSATHVCAHAGRRVGTSPGRTPQRPRMPCPPLGPQVRSEAFFLSASLVRRGAQGDVWAGKGARCDYPPRRSNAFTGYILRCSALRISSLDWRRR